MNLMKNVKYIAEFFFTWNFILSYWHYLYDSSAIFNNNNNEKTTRNATSCDHWNRNFPMAFFHFLINSFKSSIIILNIIRTSFSTYYCKLALFHSVIDAYTILEAFLSLGSSAIDKAENWINCWLITPLLAWMAHMLIYVQSLKDTLLLSLGSLPKSIGAIFVGFMADLVRREATWLPPRDHQI